MGKRKSSRKVQKAVQKPKLDKVFDCPFCNHTKTVEVKFTWKEKIGSISCRVCAASWQTTITHLSEPIDLYADWIDACEQQKLKDSPLQ